MRRDDGERSPTAKNSALTGFFTYCPHDVSQQEESGPLPSILNSLIEMHDWRLTLLAVSVCVTGLATSITLVRMARRSSWRLKRVYGGMAGIVGGLTVWATHFLGMLGYRIAQHIQYDTGQTLLSLAIITFGIALGVVLLLSNPGRLSRVLVALVAAGSVAGMHFVGTAAIRIDGGFMVWNGLELAGVVTLSLLVSLCTATWRSRDGWWGIPAHTLVASLSVCILHFGTMGAMHVVPDPSIVVPTSTITQGGLLLWVVSGATLVVLVAAIVTGTSLWSRKTSLNQLREAIDTMPDGLGFYDAEDRLVIWNARYSEVNAELEAALQVGMRFRDMLQLGVDTGLYPDAVGRGPEWIEERLAARRRLSNTLELQISDDRWLRVQDRRTAQGGIVTVVNDITDLKRDAKALCEARDAAEAANRAKSEFLANMSHEIRTPLNGVIGLTQALEKTELDEGQREMLNLIQSSGVTLKTLLSDILDLARVESGRLEIADEPFDLARAIHEAGHLYAAPAVAKGLQLFVEVDPAAAVWVRGDVVRLKQVLTNLVSNAVKFTATGFVSLTAAVGQTRTGEPILRFTVEDTGVGFNAAAKARLFTRFEQADGTITRRFGGTGLGLAICRQLSDMMGGTLDCESEPGGGSAFILTLPMVPAEAPLLQIPDLADVFPQGERRIRVLMADDHPTNRKVVELILGHAPVDLVSVEDGAQALAAAQSQTFDLILMDMQMPVMDGLTAVREIRKLESITGSGRTPIVMLTANALSDHIEAGRVAGADRHLAKPFDAAELIALVNELGGERQALAA
jgi:signal transduction histidine kinase/CheY-like chemotaxis protein